MTQDEVEIYEPAVDLNEFQSALRTIRLVFHGDYLVADLVPSVVLEQPIEIPDPCLSSLRNARPIVEAERCLRVRFSAILAVAVEEEFIEAFTELKTKSDLPRIPDQKATFPFLKVSNSSWKAKIPDYQGGDNPDLHHYKMFSMDISVDILGFLDGTEWIDNFTIEDEKPRTTHYQMF